MNTKERPGQYVRRYYRVPAFIGRPIVWTFEGPAKRGKITGFDSQYLLVRFEDGTGKGMRLHPTWNVQYPLDMDGKPVTP